MMSSRDKSLEEVEIEVDSAVDFVYEADDLCDDLVEIKDGF
jgi:hypothetical protein